MNSQHIAEKATIQSFLNCYLRETGNYRFLSHQDSLAQAVINRTQANTVILCPLIEQNLEILVGVKYWSASDRHLFSFPLFYTSSQQGQLLELDYLILSILLLKELSLAHKSPAQYDELVERIIQSCHNIKKFIEVRKKQTSSLYQFKQNFGDTEQALLLGHHLHPTPKSRQGFLSEEMLTYSPETQGAFALHYFRAHKSIILEGSTLQETATELIKAELRHDQTVSDTFKKLYCHQDEYALVPVHPWQGRWLKHSPQVKALLDQGLLEDLGQQGRQYRPTSSVRTVYHEDANFMFKLSLNVKITNSVRANLYKELERGLEINKLFSGIIGTDLKANFPNFEIIRDPAYITIPLDGNESGFATILRANAFQNSQHLAAHIQPDASCLIALCQDAIDDSSSRLSNIIHLLAERENRTTQEVSLDWFKSYLSLSIKPMLWLYFTYGIGLEAHQQNTVLELQDGYPKRCFYRDNQGYYYRRSFSSLLGNILPEISRTSETFCDDAVIDERLMYYLFINNIFGLINAFGVAQLIDENLLFKQVNQMLSEFTDINCGNSVLLTYLKQPKLRTKANLLTRFFDMDELVGSVANQSVYVDIHNPLVQTKVATLEKSYV
ncbi:IucA/IucC family siderophore biosynthesis protein [Synechococcus moorigangaii CMS01]|nr:IucA/IucC family siderophore biosynthesis protein [Synechococcus moorigangaii CMS01]